MDELLAFLTRMLDADEAAAKAAADDGTYGGRPHWSARYGSIVTDAEDEDWAVVDLSPVIEDAAAGAHIARYDPARVLREVAAKRAILDRHSLIKDLLPKTRWCAQCTDDTSWTEWPCGDVRDLAAVYSDQPGYKAEWAP